MVRLSEILFNAKIVFWDFDGVIRDYADIKVQAYVDMAADHGAEILTYYQHTEV
jgi:beta-phosphoglucomutase-like phosphatase (HAD superfamily)